jgi:hypothetical protein
MATAQTQLMPAEEFFEWIQRPENHARKYELVRGETTKPGKRHRRRAARLPLQGVRVFRSTRTSMNRTKRA